MMHAELKATVFRGYVRWLDAEGLGDEVRAGIPAPLAEMTRALPPPTQWLRAGETTLPIVEALARARDLAMVRRMSREAAAGPILAMVRPIVEGVLRLAVGPEAVVARLPFVLGASSRGFTFEVTPGLPGEAVLTMRTSSVRETRASAEAWAGAIEAFLQLAHASPSIHVVSVKPDDTISEVCLRIAWADASKNAA